MTIDIEYNLALNDETICAVKDDVVYEVRNLMKGDLVEIILYGSCARGDYTDDSDIDIALITKCDRLESKKYRRELFELGILRKRDRYDIKEFVYFKF